MTNYTKTAISTMFIFIVLIFLKCLTNVQSLIIALLVGVVLCIIDNITELNIKNNTVTDCTKCVKEGFQNTSAGVNTTIDVFDNKVKIPDSMNSYVKYQQNGDEDKDVETSLKNSIFRYANGNQSVVRPYLNDINKYYNDIHNRGINIPLPSDLIKANLEYGQELNYLGPLNMGMSNREYSYVAPNNWNFSQPVPPVCVIDRKLKNTIFPTMFNSSNVYASVNDAYTKASKITGNMQINIDYIKNVLNNPYSS